MHLEILERALRVVDLLSRGSFVSISEMCERFEISERTAYRYIESLQRMGFVLHSKGSQYKLGLDSPFFRQITERIHFTDDEALTISHLLESVTDNSPQVRHLREKLASLYDYEVLASHTIDRHVAENLANLYRAMQERRIVVLHDYASGHSRRVSDRIVEPYLFMEGNSEVRCFELSTRTNKTFKLSRIGSVELLELLWSNREEHKPMYTDLFHFSGEDRKPVSLLMGDLATSLLLEEYPSAEKEISACPDGRHKLTTEVCSYKGIARFVLGLFDDIEVVDSPEFSDYLRGRVENMRKKLGDD